MTVAGLVLKTLIESAHETATEKGWWEGDRGIGEALFKITMEVAEAGMAL
ncbi:MAG: hypothetical protein GY847_38615, partial [Proteobacteria bacterium]|nr:hypothetical protein [Pseudomonadota bacterium]